MPDKTQIEPISVTSFGAKGDGQHDDSDAIQKALDSSASVVYIPFGTYKIAQSLKIPSNTSIRAHAKAHLFLADNAGKESSSFLITNSDPVSGNTAISIEGGIWDGNSCGNPRGEDELKHKAYSGVIMNFIMVSGLSVSHLTLKDAECYYIRLGEVSNFSVSHILFDATKLRPNQDGVHLGGYCKDGNIGYLKAEKKLITGDDMVALNADDNNTRAQNMGLKCGPIRRIRIHNIEAISCHSFVRLLSVWSPIEDIEISEMRGGCRVCAVNMDACRNCVKPVAPQPELVYHYGVGHVENVYIHDCEIYKAVSEEKNALFDLHSQMHSVTIRNVIRQESKEEKNEIPTLVLSDLRPTTFIAKNLASETCESICERIGNALHMRTYAVQYDTNDDTTDLKTELDTHGSLEIPRGNIDDVFITSNVTHV